MFEIISTNIDAPLLEKELYILLGANNFWERSQISLTSLDGENDWTCTTGGSHRLTAQYRNFRANAKTVNIEGEYKILNKDLEDTYIGELIKEYNQYYRWRLLNITPGKCYTVHTDAPPQGRFSNFTNKRIHIPITTNPEAFFCYHSDMPADGLETPVKFHHMPLGSAYEVNTSLLHGAVNYGRTPRYHMVGVRYEKQA